MQTFLPYPDFKMSAECLDNKRLGKQRSECLIVLRSICKFEEPVRFIGGVYVGEGTPVTVGSIIHVHGCGGSTAGPYYRTHIQS